MSKDTPPLGRCKECGVNLDLVGLAHLCRLYRREGEPGHKLRFSEGRPGGLGDPLFEIPALRPVDKQKRVTVISDRSSRVRLPPVKRSYGKTPGGSAVVKLKSLGHMQQKRKAIMGNENRPMPAPRRTRNKEVKEPDVVEQIHGAKIDGMSGAELEEAYTHKPLVRDLQEKVDAVPAKRGRPKQFTAEEARARRAELMRKKRSEAKGQ